MADTRTVVTGGGGFIGSHLVDTLVARGDRVEVIDDFSAGKFPAQLNAHATYHELDVRDYERIAPIIAGVDTVYHVAALVSVAQSVADPRGTHDVNVNGTLSVLEAVRRGGTRRFLFVSSAAVYGSKVAPPVSEDNAYDPISPYGLHKCIGEQYTRLYGDLYGVATTIVRPFNVYGPRQRGNSPYAGVIARFIDAATRGQDIMIEGDGEQTRDFVHVSDVARALCAAVGRAEAIGQTINLGSGVATTVNMIAGLIGEAFGGVSKVTHGPARVGDIRDSFATVGKATTLLDWRPTVALADGIAELARLQ